MTTQFISKSRSAAGSGDGSRGAGFGGLLRAEWIKFRSVRGWVIGMILAALLTIFLGVFAAANATLGCQVNGGPVKTGKACLPYIPRGPGGEIVTDSFSFARQPLTGNGTITAEVTSLTGEHANLGSGPARAGNGNMVPGLVQWAKAGIIIKQSTRQGSAYAAMMVTGGHGVRMQDDFTGDTAGMPGAVSAAHPRWLRLARSGDTITGYDSADGTRWTRVGTVRLAGLPSTVQVGMFAASPGYIVTQDSFGGGSSNGGPAQATGIFDHVSLAGGAPGGTWTGSAIGGGGPAGGVPGAGGPGAGSGPAPFTRSGGRFTVTGSGDIAPVTPGPDSPFPTAAIGQSLVGAFLGLIAIVVVAAMFFSTEYRRGLIRITLAATPRRGAVLAAKAVVIGAVTFVTGLVAAVVSVAVGVPKEESSGQVLLTVPLLTEARVIVGTAAMLAVAAVLAVALGAILRRSAAAITIAVVTIVLPFLLAALNIVPAGVGAWLLRLTPAAGLAVEQSIPRYPQVTTVTALIQGYYPLSPCAGFAVLCLWAAAALALALVLLRRRDA
ncbi:MAG TPA: ABC transporter permease subunit [Streptosporangiaceae bacterium]|jgi:ABC-type transport system involved in multi-copper enzyme maturation permease subunit